jgi:hypothetical protein
MSQPLKRDDLAEQLNTTFQIHFALDMIMDAELIAVSEITKMGPFESFAITFLVPDDCPIHQQIYPIDHPEMGLIELFLVPSGKDEKGTTYVSTFSYRKE